MATRIQQQIDPADTLVATGPPPPPPRPPRTFGWEWALALLLALVAIAAAVWFLRDRIWHQSSAPSTTTVVAVHRPATHKLVVAGARMPYVIGIKLADAQAQVKRAKLTAKVVRRKGNAPAGNVLGQSPKAGAPVKTGTLVTLVVSAGKPGVKLPSFVHQKATDAVKSIAAMKLTPVITMQSANAAPPGTVVSQRPPAGTTEKPGAQVTLFVAKAHPKKAQTQPTTTVVVTTTTATRSSTPPPTTSQGNDYRGMQLQQAVQRIAQGRQQVIVVYVASSRPAGIVVGDAPAGGRERLQVSRGSATQTANVPDETGVDASQAANDLRAAGFNVIEQQWPVSDSASDGTVVYETPTGTQPRGATIVLYIGASP